MRLSLYFNLPATSWNTDSVVSGPEKMRTRDYKLSPSTSTSLLEMAGRSLTMRLERPKPTTILCSHPQTLRKPPRKSIDVHHVVSQGCMQEGKALTVMFNKVKVLPVMRVQRCGATRAVSTLEQAIARATRRLHFQWNGQVQTA
jgi:hypothetical protein